MPSAQRSARPEDLRSYSTAVRWMKVLLPLGAALVIALIFVIGRDRGGPLDAGSAAGAAALSAGLKLENPRFDGVTERGEPFVLTAVSALPDGAMPDRIDLDRPSGEIALGDGRTLSARADTGRMLRKAERLHLDGDVVIVTSDGYRLRTERIEMDLDTKSALAPGRVEMHGPRGGVAADRVHLTPGPAGEGDYVLRFDGRVRVTMIPEGGGADGGIATGGEPGDGNPDAGGPGADRHDAADPQGGTRKAVADGSEPVGGGPDHGNPDEHLPQTNGPDGGANAGGSHGGGTPGSGDPAASGSGTKQPGTGN